MSVNACFTNNMALVIGLVAKKHPDCAIQIEWRAGQSEQIWFITATDGVNDTMYVVDDESGTWMPMREKDIAALDRGEELFADVAATREP